MTFNPDVSNQSTTERPFDSSELWLELASLGLNLMTAGLGLTDPSLTGAVGQCTKMIRVDRNALAATNRASTTKHVGRCFVLFLVRRPDRALA